jgi:DNA-directed RNA polymerase subunit beta
MLSNPSIASCGQAMRPDLETAEALLEKLFFNPKRYDLGSVGRFRINQKLGLTIDSETTLDD